MLSILDKFRSPHAYLQLYCYQALCQTHSIISQKNSHHIQVTLKPPI